MDGRAEFREASQPCRSDKQSQFLDINPKPSLSEHTLFWFTRDRAKHSHHHLLSFGCFFVLFFGFFSFSQNLSRLCANAHTFLSWHLWRWALWPRHLQGARLLLALPVFLALGLWPQGLTSLAPSTTFSVGTPSGGRLWQVVYLSQGYWQRSWYRWNSSVWAQMSACAADASSPAVSHLPEASSSPLLPLPRPPPLSLRSPSSHVAEDELKPGQAERSDRSAPLEAFQLLGTQPRLVFLPQFRHTG